MKIIIPITLFFLLIISRLLSDIPNFTPTLSLMIFTGFYIQSRSLAVIIVMASQVLSDLYLGYNPSMFFVYASFLLITYLSPLIIKKLDIVSVFFASILCPSIFFIISNFGVWLTMGLYPLNILGLLSCYLAGIPFFQYSLISTILFSFTILVLHKAIVKKASLQSS
ncbi:MAG: hypothetical protein CMD88_00800 [Gammaproteobacteria bacterium]|nr:hypothetical protein [Gammaproteobacteria bacterium]